MIDSGKFDLDAITVTLDYQKLKEVALIAMCYSRDQLNRELHKWYELGHTPSPVYAESMLKDAQSLVTASIAYYYLVNGENREIKEIA